MVEDNETDSVEETSEKFEVIYSCLRCATNVTNTELSRLPEIDSSTSRGDPECLRIVTR